MVEEKIYNLLALGSGVLAVEVVKAALPSFSEAEICCALVALCVAEKVTIDGQGVRLLTGEDGSDKLQDKPYVDSEESTSVPAVSEIKDDEASSEEALDVVAHELLGDPVPKDYSDTYLPDEDIEAMLASMGYTQEEREPDPAGDEREELPPLPSADEPLIGSVDPLTFSGSVKRLPLKTRAANYCEREGVRTVGELLRALPIMESAPGLGAGSVNQAREILALAAVPPSLSLTEDQVDALSHLSGSSSLIFDLFGVLCQAEALPNEAKESACADPRDAIVVEELGLSEPVWRSLRANHIETVGQLRVLGLDGMRQLRSFGEKKISVVREALIAVIGEDVLDGESLSNVVTPDEYLSRFSARSRATCERLVAKLVGREIPLLHDAALVTLLPYAAKIGESDLSSEGVETALDELVDSLEVDGHACIACQAEVRRRVRKMLKHASKGKADAGFVVPSAAPWHMAVEALLAAEPSLSFDEETQTLSVKVPTVLDWIDTLKDSHRQALLLRLQGSTLEEVGNAMGVTRERVRQITTKAFSRRPALAEDVYREFFDSYEIDKDRFTAVTGESGEVFEYLDLTKPKKCERLPLESALDDEMLNEHLRENIQSVLDEGFTYIDGVRTPLRRKPVMEALLRRHTAERCVSLEELLDLYRAFIDEHDMDDEEAFQGSGPRAVGSSLDRWGFSMQSWAPVDDDGVRRDIRYFAWDEKDFEPLRQALWNFQEGRTIECSTALLMRDEGIAEAAAVLDVRNEYELHCAIKRGLPDCSFVALGRRPMVTFGNADRNSQVLELIREIGPADSYELAQAYEERYGVAEATFRGTFLKDFSAYENEGKYICVDADLTVPQKDYLAVLLGGSLYVPLNEVRERFLASFPSAPAALVNDRALGDLGYETSGSLVVRCDANLAAVFGAIMDSREVFGVGDADLSLDVVRHEAFRSELNKRIRAFEVVEFAPNRFVRTSALARSGTSVSIGDLQSFVDEAIEFMEPERPYSVRSLRKAGFDHPVFRLADVFDIANEYFFGSLMATGYVSNRLKLTSCNDVSFFCQKVGSLAMPDVVAYEVSLRPGITVAAMCELLLEEHGVDVNKALLRMMAKRAGITLPEAESLSVDDGDAASASGSTVVVEEIDFFGEGLA